MSQVVGRVVFGGYNTPAGRIDAQGWLDFTPAARQLAQAVRNRETKAQRMLARLRQGPATTLELMTLGGSGFSSRLRELRNAGHVIECEQHCEDGREWAVYTLRGEK